MQTKKQIAIEAKIKKTKAALKEAQKVDRAACKRAAARDTIVNKTIKALERRVEALDKKSFPEHKAHDKAFGRVCKLEDELRSLFQRLAIAEREAAGTATVVTVSSRSEVKDGKR